MNYSFLEIYQSAMDLYGLIHARYILSARGLTLMVRRARSPAPGSPCPRRGGVARAAKAPNVVRIAGARGQGRASPARPPAAARVNYLKNICNYLNHLKIR
jgi:hypothetical protein